MKICECASPHVKTFIGLNHPPDKPAQNICAHCGHWWLPGSGSHPLPVIRLTKPTLALGGRTVIDRLANASRLTGKEPNA